jgi:hypothetical protein
MSWFHCFKDLKTRVVTQIYHYPLWLARIKFAFFWRSNSFPCHSVQSLFQWNNVSHVLIFVRHFLIGLYMGGGPSIRGAHTQTTFFVSNNIYCTFKLYIAHNKASCLTYYNTLIVISLCCCPIIRPWACARRGLYSGGGLYSEWPEGYRIWPAYIRGWGFIWMDLYSDGLILCYVNDHQDTF